MQVVSHNPDLHTRIWLKCYLCSGVFSYEWVKPKGLVHVVSCGCYHDLRELQYVDTGLIITVERA